MEDNKIKPGTLFQAVRAGYRAKFNDVGWGWDKDEIFMYIETYKKQEIGSDKKVYDYYQYWFLDKNGRRVDFCSADPLRSTGCLVHYWLKQI